MPSYYSKICLFTNAFCVYKLKNMLENMEIRDLIMRKRRILITILILFLLWINSVSADDQLSNIPWTVRQSMTITSNDEFPTPMSAKLPENWTLSDWTLNDDKDRVQTYYLIDFDENGISDHVLFMANVDPDIYNQPSKIRANNLSRKIYYKNQTIINNFGVSYQKEDITVYHTGKIDEADLNYSVEYISWDIRNRFDLYTVVRYNLSSEVECFCPLVLDLDTWPQYMMFYIDPEIKGSEINSQIVIGKITNCEIRNDMKINLKYQNNDSVSTNHEVYGGILILQGFDKSIIINKPSLGRFNPSPDYFFKTEKLSNGHIQASVCTISHEGKLLPPNGPNAYIVFGEPDDQKLSKMGLTLDNITDPILHPPESIQIKFFKGRVWPSGGEPPLIVPKIKFKASEFFFPSVTFTLMTQEGETNETIQSKNGTFIFEEPILLNGNSWMYPFDKYESVIHIKPPVIQTGTSDLEFDSEVSFEGTALFENNMILFQVERTIDHSIKYFIYLIISVFVFIFSKSHFKNLKMESFQPIKLLEILALVFAPLLGYFFIISDEIISLGSIPYVLMLMWLIILLCLRWKKLDKRWNKIVENDEFISLDEL